MSNQYLDTIASQAMKITELEKHIKTLEDYIEDERSDNGGCMADWDNPDGECCGTDCDDCCYADRLGELVEPGELLSSVFFPTSPGGISFHFTIKG